MDPPEKASGLLTEFDPLCSPDHSLSSGQAPSSDGQLCQGEDSTCKANGGATLATTPSPGEKTAARPQSSEAPPASLTTPPHSSVEVHAQSPSTIQDMTKLPPQSIVPPQSSVLASQSAEVSATPTFNVPVIPTTTDCIAKVAPIANEEGNVTLEAPIKPQSADSAISPDPSSSAKKKKKRRKKHKHHASSEALSKSRTSEPAGSLSSAQIGSQISEIDQFLQSLKMGAYDAVLPQVTPTPPVATVATTSTVAPVVGSKVSTAEATLPIAGSKVTAGGATVGSKVTMAAQASVGLQLIGGFDSSSSSSDSESSSESSEEEEVAMVVIE